MPKFTYRKPQVNGMALGGIGTGSVELLPDGEFHYWQISNQTRWGGTNWDRNVDDGEKHTGALSFWVRENSCGRIKVRKLGMKTDAEDFTYRMFAWNKPIEQIDYEGKFPVCTLDYKDSGLKCNLKADAVAPFVPHNSTLSATPGFYMDFTVENPSDEEIEISLLGALEPSFVYGKNTSNKLTSDSDGDTKYITLVSGKDEEGKAQDTGNICFSLTGGDISYITGDYFRFLREFVSHSRYGVTQESFLFGFRENGTLPNTEIGVKPEKLPEDKWIEKLSDEDISSIASELSKYPFVMSFINRISHIKEGFPNSREDNISIIKYAKEQFSEGTDNFGSCALCSKVTLAPHEKKTVSFVLSWYFPNHRNQFSGKYLGHYYSTLFADSYEANKLLCDKRADIFDKAVAFSALMTDTTMPSAYPDAWLCHLSTIVKDSWWLENGRFGLWEGLGYCGFHTTDITYHASYGLTVIFPDLQKKQMKMGADMQREDGRCHHFFYDDMEHVDNGFDRVDMNNQFVLMVTRDFLFTGDREYLTSLWGNVVRAMASIEALDTDNDGLPDTDTRRNTYDAWNFAGTPAYISILWLAALKAGILLADEMGAENEKAKWSALLDKGLKSLEERLYNGKYYSLWNDGTTRDESLMTNQLDGEWYLRAMGIGGNLSDERVKSVLETIFANNFDPEDGLINAVTPEGAKTTMYTYKNCQAEAVWTGVGYAMASLAQSVGMKDTALMEIESIHRGQSSFGMFYNHWECGPHYTRPLSSWSTLNSSLGMKINAEKKTLAFTPCEDKVVLPLILPDVIAKLTFDGKTFHADIIEGSLAGWTISVN